MEELDFEPEMIGREKELNELKTYLDKAVNGQGNAVFISGEAGIGKTRLTIELKLFAQSKGFKILSGQGLSESLTPYMPFIEALRSEGLENLFAEEVPRIEAVYLVTDSGLLIRKVLRKETELEPEIFTAMLTTVGNFVKDALSLLDGEKKEGTLNSLGYENYRILIESGGSANIVVILTGRENEFLIDDMREVLGDVNKQYGGVLRNWRGDDDEMQGIEELIESLITSGKYDGIYYGSDDPRARRNLLFENVSLGLLRQAKSNPTLLCIEDLHWVDPSSLALMHYVARNTKKCGLLILGTYRPEDVTAEEGKKHPLINTMRLMNREDLYEKIELERLSEETIVEFLSTVIGETDIGDEFRKRIYQESEGNPLFMIELVNLLIEEKVLVEAEGTWSLAKDLEKVNIPSKIYDVILRRLDRLDKELRNLLEYASVIGETFTSNTLVKAIDVKRLKLLENLRSLEKNHRLIHSHNENFKFDHAKIKEVIYSEMPSELRTEYHTIIGDAIEESNQKNLEAVIGDLAFHYYHSRDKEKALHYLARAAEKAKNEYSNEEAIRFYTYALDLEEDLHKRREAIEALAQIHFLIGDYGKSIESYENALELTKEKNKSAEIKAKIGEILRIKGEYEDSIKICVEALDLVEGEASKEEALCLNNIGAVHKNKGEYNRAFENFERSLEIWERIGDKKGIAASIIEIGTVHYERGEFDKALEHYERSLEIIEEIGDQVGIARSLNCVGLVQHDRGEYDKALEHYEKSLEIREKIGDQSGIAIALNCIGVLHMERGEYDKALEHHEKSLEISDKIGDQKAIVGSSINIGLLHRVRGQYEKALEYLSRSVQISERAGHQRSLMNCFGNIGIVHSRRGDYDRALEYFEKTLEISEKLGSQMAIGTCLIHIGNVYYERGEYDKALEFLRRSLKISEKIGYQTGIAFSLDNIGVMHTRRGEYDEALECHRKSIEINEKTGNQENYVESLNNIGDLHREKGEYDKALKYSEKSLELGEKLGNQRSIAFSLNSIGYVHYERREYDKALEYLKKSLELGEMLGERWQMSICCTRIAEVHLKTGDLQKALNSCNRAFDISREIGSRHEIANSRRIFGMIHSAQEKWTESIENFEESIDLLEKAGVKKELADVQYEFGLMWKAKGDLEKAKEHLNKALEIFEGLKLEKRAENVKKVFDDINSLSKK